MGCLTTMHEIVLGKWQVSTHGGDCDDSRYTVRGRIESMEKGTISGSVLHGPNGRCKPSLSPGWLSRVMTWRRILQIVGGTNRSCLKVYKSGELVTLHTSSPSPSGSTLCCRNDSLLGGILRPPGLPDPRLFPVFAIDTSVPYLMSFGVPRR